METSEKAKLTDEELLQILKGRREKANLAVKKKEDAIKEKNRKKHERDIVEAGKLVEDFGMLDGNKRILAGILGEAVIVIQKNASKVTQWEKFGEYILSFPPSERKEKALNREKITGGSEN